jgi:hypothetical protein
MPCIIYDVVTYIKAEHLRWSRYVIQLEEQDPVKRILATTVEDDRDKVRL